MDFYRFFFRSFKNGVVDKLKLPIGPDISTGAWKLKSTEPIPIVLVYEIVQKSLWTQQLLFVLLTKKCLSSFFCKWWDKTYQPKLNMLLLFSKNAQIRSMWLIYIYIPNSEIPIKSNHFLVGFPIAFCSHGNPVMRFPFPPLRPERPTKPTKGEGQGWAPSQSLG